MKTYLTPMKPLKSVNYFEPKKFKDKAELTSHRGKPSIGKRFGQNVRRIRAFATVYDQKLQGSASKNETLL